MRRPLVPVLLVAAAVLATFGASFDWQRVDGAEAGWRFGLLDGGGWLARLFWSTRPPTTVLIVMVLSAWALAGLALRRPRVAARLALPVALMLAVPVSLGSSLPLGMFRRPLPADVTVIPGWGLWAAVGSLLLAAFATAVGLSPRVASTDVVCDWPR